MRYLGNNSNIVRTATTLTGTNGVASDAIYRTDTAAKVGGGVVSLVGPYTGAADTTIEVEIVDNGGSTIQVSQPAFTGVGSGTMGTPTATSVDPQSVTVTLEDLGTQTLKAYANFQGVTIKAKAAGAGGNDIAIDVDHSALVYGDTAWSLQEDVRQGSNEYVGEHWNFGAAILEPLGTIPVTAPRVRLGTDPQVYRQYKRYRDGRYIYSFDPVPVRDVKAGAKVHTVTGTRTVTVTDGVTPEVMTGITSLYDALSAIRDNSALVYVDGPIINDRAPGGQGIAELSVRTRSYAIGVNTSGTGPIERAELNVTVTDTAPTEILHIVCTDTSIPGAETWAVRGDVSGEMAAATTAQIYTHGAYSFTIPPAEVPNPTVSGMILVEYIPSGVHSSEVPLPSLCVEQPMLGSAARNGKWEYVYTRRPAGECDCNTGSLSGGPDRECLGIDPTEETVSSADLLRYQLIRVDRWYSQLSRLLVRFEQSSSLDGRHQEYLGQYRQQARVLNGLRQSITQAATRIFNAIGANAVPAWQAAHAYTSGAIIEPVSRNGYLYRATVAGTSGASAPSFPTSVGGTVTDSGVTWECFSRDAIGAFEDAFASVKNEVTPNFIAPHKAYSTGTEYLLGTHPYTVLPSTPNGHYYQQVTGGTTGGTEPAWPTDGTTVTDGGVIWQDIGPYWLADSDVAAGTIIAPTIGSMFEAIVGGTTDSTIPDFDAINVYDGSVVWTRIAIIDPVEKISSHASQDEEGWPITDPVSYVSTLSQYFAEAYAVAGVNANFDKASVEGDGCWQDEGDQYWWAFDGDEPYLPVQTGHYYHSAKLGMDADGHPYASSTREFGFGPRFGCPENLVEGDKIRVTITGVGGISSRGYQQDDTFDVRVINAVPLPLGGGQTGDDTLTWSVVLSTAGRIADYALVTTAPAAYSGSVLPSGTLGFTIATGGIPFALGDQFQFAIEGGRFKWRRDAGAWSANLDIASTALADGLSAEFVGGAAPSWVAGDRWSFKAEAIHGPANLRSPQDGEFVWTTSTVIEVEPSGSAAMQCMMLANHTIPSDATITLTGSDDNFATTPFSQGIAWRRDHLFVAVSATRAKYRLTINRGGSARWLYLGLSTQPTIRTGHKELGALTKRYRLPSTAARRALSATVEHSALTQASLDALLDMLEHAGLNDDRLFGVAPNDDETESTVVRYAQDSLDVGDELLFQPRDTDRRLQTATLQLEAAA